ncbi:E3 ubiquitin-protein ligase HERC2 [Durusdinium trenchii]|uniref:E3 ubiquitin-protein ligase HERC2 n=1 Tax=Durusdinium trenchii TaxID=1381693 RepID=A0ABP0MWS8_9DINO
MVREGESTSSTQKTDRLSTGALVEELELKGDRLHYKLKKGTGPEEGWVSVKLTGKDLLVPWVEIGERLGRIEYAQMKEIASKNDPGDYYGMKFPYTKDMLVEMGPEWLTQAFHKSGVLPRDNAVTKITDAKEFVGGGAGLKCTFTVEYKKDEAYLHKKLFAKLPHKPGGSDRYFVSCMWNHDRPEIVFNIFLQDSVPFRVPKFYFGDISATTTNFILITETIDWAEGGKKVFSPGEIEPAYDKYKDRRPTELTGDRYYMACCRALGKMAGYHKQKRLHKSIDEMFPMPDPIPAIPPLPSLDALTKKQNAAKIDQFLSWSSLNRLDVGETAKAVMPDEITDPAFLQQWKVEIQDVADAWINDNWSLDIEDQEMPGSSPKSSFLQRDEQNEVEVGLLDWGVLACGPLIGAMQGADSVAAAAFAATFQFAEHETRECSAACCGGAQTCSDVIALWGSSQELLAELARARGPLPVDQEFGVAAFWTVASGRAHSTRIKLQQLIEDYRRSCLACDLDSVVVHSNRFLRLGTAVECHCQLGNVTQVLKFTKAAEWQEIKDWMDPRLLDRFQTRAHTTQFKEALQLYRKWDLYGVFHKWKRDNGLPKK